MNIKKKISFSIIIFNLFFCINTTFSQSTMWGSAVGGAGLGGVIFKLKTDGTYEVKKTFASPYPGKSPFGSLIQASNGKLYGMTSSGGSSDRGLIFEFDPSTSSYVSKYEFDGVNGGFPLGDLIEDNGRLYGLTSGGGANDLGVLFSFDLTTNTYSKRLDLADSAGAYPTGSLMKSSNGKMYGLTLAGGTNGSGVIFEYDPTTDSYIVKYSFDDTNGGSTRGGVIEFNNKLYGLAGSGGANGVGVLFEMDLQTFAYVNKYDFVDSLGAFPNGSLTQFNNKFYGMSRYGGANSAGVVFEFDPSTNSYTDLFDFDYTSGAGPRGNLIIDNGGLYGMTSLGGDNGRGIIFQLDMLTKNLNVLYSFDGTNGAFPAGSLSIAAGKMFGTTINGGKTNSGVLFQFDAANNSFQKLIDLSIYPNGNNPSGHLLYSSNKKLYGLTHDGGKSDEGVIFQVDLANGAYTKIYDFDYNTGSNPSGSLIEYNGIFYGLTSAGGINGAGVLFKFDPNTLEYTSYNFDGNNGAYPLSNLLPASNGKLYGLCYVGGANLLGSLFEFDPSTGSLISKFDFDSQNGSYPFGSLVASSNGKLYGLAAYGGANDIGVLFEYDPIPNTFTKKFDFTDTTGALPFGSLTEVNGKLYGMTAYGGINQLGVIFEYDPSSNTYTDLFDFDDTNGGIPNGSLISINGKLYGMTTSGGSNEMGVAFEYDPTNNQFKDLHDFDGVSGGSPFFELTFVNSPPVLIKSIPDQTASQLKAFNFTVDDLTFSDPDNDILSYKAKLVTGSMPAWLQFDAANRAFSGTPTKDDHSVIIRVVVKDPTGDSVSTDFNLKISVITSVEPGSKENISAYPNPSKGVVMVEIPKVEGDTEITVVDLVGRVVARAIVPASDEIISLNLESLDKGLYILHLDNGSCHQSLKIIITH